MRGSALRRRVASQPSITGSERSMRMMSGVWSRARCKASRPLAASAASNPEELEILAIHLRASGVVVYKQHPLPRLRFIH